MKITNPLDVGLVNASPPPFSSSQESNSPDPEETLHLDSGEDTTPKEILHLEKPKDPAAGEALPRNTDPLTFTNKTLQKNQELLRIKSAFNKASKEVHYNQINERASKFLKSLSDAPLDKSIKDQVEKLITRVGKRRYDLTQKRRLRRVLNRGRRR